MSENKGNLEECENDQGTSCEKADNLIQPSKSCLDEASSSSSSSTSSSSKENSRFTKLSSPVFGASSFSSSSSFTKYNLGLSSNDKETSSKPLFLRPSQLLSRNSLQTASSSSTLTNNPFAKNVTLQEETNQKDAKETEKKENPSTKDSIDTSKITPKFVPLGSNSNQQKEESSGSQSSSSSISGFVFGQNLHERVAVPTETNHATCSKDEPKDSKPTETSSSTNGSSMLFSSVLKQEALEKENSENSEKSSKSLSEAAREYEESRAIKRKYQEVTIVTGEEDEANVLQVSCKLFSYDKSNGNWVERGRGTLRLNDMTQDGQVQSRVIMRTTGSLRVILNTKIWSGMAVEKTSTKSVRLTAMDATGQVKVFLVMSSPKDIDTLYRALQTRVNKRQLAENACSSAKRMSLDLAGSQNDSPEKIDSSTEKSQDS